MGNWESGRVLVRPAFACRGRGRRGTVDASRGEGRSDRRRSRPALLGVRTRPEPGAARERAARNDRLAGARGRERRPLRDRRSPLRRATAVDLHVSTADSYRLAVYRLGWYGGTGARLVRAYPTCDTDEQGRFQAQRGGLSRRCGGLVGDGRRSRPAPTGRAATTSSRRRSPTEALRRRSSSCTSGRTLLRRRSWSRCRSTPGRPTTRGAARASTTSSAPRSIVVSLERPLGFMAQSPMWWEIQTRALPRARGLRRLLPDRRRHGRRSARACCGIVSSWSRATTNTGRARCATVRHRARRRARTSRSWARTTAYWNVSYGDGHRTVVSAKSLYDPNPVLRGEDGDVPRDRPARVRADGCPCTSSSSRCRRCARLYRDRRRRGRPVARRNGLPRGRHDRGVVGREHDVINPYPESCFHPGLTVLFHYDGAQRRPERRRRSLHCAEWRAGLRVRRAAVRLGARRLAERRLARSPRRPSSSGRGVPVDPRLQQFMRNALDDLTRPPAPVGLTVERVDRLVRISVSPPADARVLGFVAAVKTATGWLRLCHGTSSCTATLPPGRRVRRDRCRQHRCVASRRRVAVFAFARAVSRSSGTPARRRRRASRRPHARPSPSSSPGSRPRTRRPRRRGTSRARASRRAPGPGTARG